MFKKQSLQNYVFQAANELQKRGIKLSTKNLFDYYPELRNQMAKLQQIKNALYQFKKANQEGIKTKMPPFPGSSNILAPSPGQGEASPRSGSIVQNPGYTGSGPSGAPNSPGPGAPPDPISAKIQAAESIDEDLYQNYLLLLVKRGDPDIRIATEIKNYLDKKKVLIPTKSAEMNLSDEQLAELLHESADSPEPPKAVKKGSPGPGAAGMGS